MSFIVSLTIDEQVHTRNDIIKLQAYVPKSFHFFSYDPGKHSSGLITAAIADDHRG